LAHRVRYFLIALFCLNIFKGSAQDQNVADSLARIYQLDDLPDTAKLELLSQLSFNEIKNYNLSLQYAEDLISLAQKDLNNEYLFKGYFQKGNKERILGNYKKALAAFFNSAEVAKKSKNLVREASAYDAIAGVYSLANDDENAMLYHRKGIETLRRSADAKTLASAILNMGEAFRMAGNYDSALHYFAEAEQIFGKINYPKGKFYSIGNIGMVYASQGKTGLAENDLNQAIDFLEASDDYYPVCVYLISLSDVYLQKNKIDKALSYAKRSWQLAQQHDLKEQIRDANLKLSELNQKDHDPEQAFNFYKKYIAARDSINNINNVQEMANLRTNFEVAQKQKEVNVLHQQKYMQKVLLIVALAVIAIIVLLIIILLRNYRQKQTAYALLSKQKDISEQQREQIDKSLQQLKRTQAHLIQSE